MTDKQIPNKRRQYEYKSVFTYTDNTTDDNDKIMENLHKQIIIDGQGCHKCIYSKMNGMDLICTEWQEVIEDDECLCSSYKEKSDE